jgi:branched-chain amino acid aminotransferase
MAAIFWHGGRWYEDEQPKLLGPMDHAMWMASIAFDGARGFDGCAPDLDRHCARLIDSTRKMLLEPTMTAEEVLDLCRQALMRVLLRRAAGTSLYTVPIVDSCSCCGCCRAPTCCSRSADRQLCPEWS